MSRRWPNGCGLSLAFSFPKSNLFFFLFPFPFFCVDYFFPFPQIFGQSPAQACSAQLGLVVSKERAAHLEIIIIIKGNDRGKVGWPPSSQEKPHNAFCSSTELVNHSELCKRSIVNRLSKTGSGVYVSLRSTPVISATPFMVCGVAVMSKMIAAR